MYKSVHFMYRSVHLMYRSAHLMYRSVYSIFKSVHLLYETVIFMYFMSVIGLLSSVLSLYIVHFNPSRKLCILYSVQSFLLMYIPVIIISVYFTSDVQCTVLYKRCQTQYLCAVNISSVINLYMNYVCKCAFSNFLKSSTFKMVKYK